MRRITSDNFPFYVQCFKRNIISRFSTFLSYIKMKWWGIDIGSGCKFNGLPIVNRFPESRIVIGSFCRFNSAPGSNQIGVNHSCIISTQREKASIKIGDNCGFSGTVIGASENIVLGNRVRCGANVLLTDTDWHTDDPRAGLPKPIIIENDVWLGINVTVLKGVTIGAGTVVGANSTVTKPLPGGIIAAGNPAKVIKQI